jgi:hypothetical protein
VAQANGLLFSSQRLDLFLAGDILHAATLILGQNMSLTVTTNEHTRVNSPLEPWVFPPVTKLIPEGGYLGARSYCICCTQMQLTDTALTYGNCRTIC